MVGCENNNFLLNYDGRLVWCGDENDDFFYISSIWVQI